jgi:hypothetical protein
VRYLNICRGYLVLSWHSAALKLMTWLISVLHSTSYLRQEQLSIKDISYDALCDGRIKWGSPPKWLNASPTEIVGKEDKSIYSIETGASDVLLIGCGVERVLSDFPFV